MSVFYGLFELKSTFLVGRWVVTKNVYISNEILAEVVYVLLGVYEIKKEDISTQLIELINFNNISVSNHNIIQKALEFFKTKNIDFVDCLLCSYSTQDEIITFDKKLNKCVETLK